MTFRHWITAAALGLTASLTSAGCANPAGLARRTEFPAGKVEGPVSGGTRGFPMTSSIVDLDRWGYSETEFFISGTAHAFAPAPGTEAGKDGHWTARPRGPELPYKTRMLVRLPQPGKFNGTLLVEWMQELFGTERDVNYRWNADALLRRGFGWIGVSLHHEGVDGDKGYSLKRWDPERYGSLTIPNSDLSYDIYSQVGRLLRSAGRVAGSPDPLRGLRPRELIAVGNSLSAWRLSTYVNAVQPRDRAFDGFYLQDFRQKTVQDRADAAFPHDRWVRSDIGVPVMLFNMMPAAIRSAGQPTGPNIRIWEPAGAPHTNAFHMARGAAAEKRDTGGTLNYCPAGRANDIPGHYFSSAALIALDHWVKGTGAAPAFPPIEVRVDQGTAVASTDDHGNARGGMRHPWVDLPIARYAWEGDCIGGSGRTFAFSPTQLRRLYGSPARYKERFRKAVKAAERDGKILPEHTDEALQTAKVIRW